MRRLLFVCALCAVLAGCAGANIKSVALGTSEALTQAQGCAQAIATLTASGTSDEATKTQISNWKTWLDIALKSAGIVATAVAGS